MVMFCDSSIVVSGLGKRVRREDICRPRIARNDWFIGRYAIQLGQFKVDAHNAAYEFFSAQENKAITCPVLGIEAINAALFQVVDEEHIILMRGPRRGHLLKGHDRSREQDTTEEQ